MLTLNGIRRSFALFSAVALIGSAVACDDGPTDLEQEPEVVAVRITAGAQTVTIDEFGQQTGNLTIPVGSTAVAVAWLRADGSLDPVVNTEDFEVRMIAQGSTGITFTPAGAFAGTLNATTTGNKVVQVQLFHFEEQHDEFGKNLTLTVQ